MARKPSAYAEWKRANEKMETAPVARPVRPFSIFADTSSDRNAAHTAPTQHAMFLQDGWKPMHGYQDED